MEKLKIYLTDAQQRQMQRRAMAGSTSLAAEVRSAINTHLARVSVNDVALLDAATRQVERDIRKMVERLVRANKELDAVLAQRSHRAYLT